MKKKLLIKTFERFVVLRRTSGKKFGPNKALLHDDFRVSNGVYGIFPVMADDFTQNLIAALNRFFYDIYQADCWVKATASLEQGDRMSVLYEFAEPLLELSISRPYSLRNQFVFAATHLLHQANRFVQPKWRDNLPPDKEINFNVLCSLKSNWTRFEAFKNSLSLLNDQAFKRQTRNYRHRMQHQFGSRLHVGLTTYFDRVQTKEGIVYTYKAIPPLELTSLIQALVDQHARALDVFDAYWKLLDEILSKWPDSERTTHGKRILLDKS